MTTLHPATVHFPIALLILSSVAGLLYLYWQPRAELRILVWWTMPVGWLAVGAAILTGLLAQAGLPPQAPYRGLLNWHISSGLALLVLYAALLYLRWLRRPKQKSNVGSAATQNAHADPLLDDAAARWWLTLLLLLGIGLVVASGWNGGRLVYDWGVNVGPF
ncbi:MAG: DUF2231 domain-containing protein [Caldilineaceae bacterium]